jgi:hypothetical protein
VAVGEDPAFGVVDHTGTGAGPGAEEAAGLGADEDDRRGDLVDRVDDRGRLIEADLAHVVRGGIVVVVRGADRVRRSVREVEDSDRGEGAGQDARNQGDGDDRGGRQPAMRLLARRDRLRAARPRRSGVLPRRS